MSNTKVNPVCGFFQGLAQTPVAQALKDSAASKYVQKYLGELDLDFSSLSGKMDGFCAYEFKVDNDTFCSAGERLKNIRTETPNLFSTTTLSDLPLAQRVALVEDTTLNPLLNGIIFQGFIQDIMLTQLPKAMLPEHEKESIDSPLVKTFRTVITAGAYAVAHSFDSTSDQPFDQETLAAHFFAGVFFSFLKETDLGFLGSLGGQMLVGGLTHLPQLPPCAAS